MQPTQSEFQKKLEALGVEIGKLVATKNAAYGDSFRKSSAILSVFFPAGVKTEQLENMLAITRVIDKMFRIATAQDAFGEDPWKDIAGYALLSAALHKEQCCSEKHGSKEKCYKCAEEYDIGSKIRGMDDKSYFICASGCVQKIGKCTNCACSLIPNYMICYQDGNAYCPYCHKRFLTKCP